MRRLLSSLLALSLAAAAGCARARSPADFPPAPAGLPPSPAKLPPAPGNPPLRYDGLYRTEVGLANPIKGETAWAYLRFYPEGTVIYTSRFGPPPHSVGLWDFVITDERYPSGTVTLRDGLLSFSMRAPGLSPVDYVGEARGDSLHLRWHSRINGHRGENVWVFVPTGSDPGPRPTGKP